MRESARSRAFPEQIPKGGTAARRHGGTIPHKIFVARTQKEERAR